MVQLEIEPDLLSALEETLRGTLPQGWQALVIREPADADRADATLEVVSPTGSRASVCVEAKRRAEPAQLLREVDWLQRCGAALVVAPRLSPRARRILEDADISWLEPEGDYRITIDGLFIERLGREERRRDVGAPDTRYVSDLFSGGALRVVRWLLIEPDRSWTLADIAKRTGLTPGFVSRAFKTLARDAYLNRARGANRVRDRDALLDSWAAAPAPDGNASERVATVGGPEALARMIRESTVPTQYAITAEAAADRLAPLARFSRVELYVDDGRRWDEKLGLTPVPRGGNLVLIKPVDRGVFDGSFQRDGVVLVSRPQLYVDLVRRGGAAAEAAAFLRERGELWPR